MIIDFECVYGSKKDFNKYVKCNKSTETLIVDWTHIKYKLKKNDPYDMSPSNYMINVSVASVINSAIKSKKPPTKIIFLIQNLEKDIICNLKDFVNNLTPCYFKLIYFNDISYDIFDFFDKIEKVEL